MGFRSESVLIFAPEVEQLITQAQSLNRKKQRLESLLIKNKKQQNPKHLSICFGGTQLFKQQFYLNQNNKQFNNKQIKKFATHEDWKKEFQNKRNNSLQLSS